MLERARLVVALSALSVAGLPAQTDFPRGVMTFISRNYDWNQMVDSLHLNWVQGGGYGDFDVGLAQNNGQLNAIFMRYDSVMFLSRGQHMVYEAEFGSVNPLRNYFDEKPDSVGTLEGNMWESDVSVKVAGYMVEAAVPNDEYRYGVTEYTASFILRTLQGQPGNPDVATLEIWCVTPGHNSHLLSDSLLEYNLFPTDGSSKTFEVNFSLTPVIPPSYSIRSNGILVGGDSSIVQSVSNCSSIDLRVYWHDQVTTWLDKIIVEDATGKLLHAGGYDATIASEAAVMKKYAKIQRAYLYDEPYVSSFLSHRKVDEKVYQVFASGNERGRSVTANDKHLTFERFMLDATPHELLVDCYPIYSDVPSPKYSTAEANSLGIEPFTTAEAYTTALQTRIQNLLIQEALKGAAEAVLGTGTNFWFMPQLHGEYIVDSGGKFRWPSSDPELPNYPTRRPPTGIEVEMMINLGLTYGAKGIMAYPFGTDTTHNFRGNVAYFPGLVSKDPVGGFYKDHWSNEATLEAGPAGSKTFWVGYQEKWDSLASSFKYLEDNSSLWSSLAWQGAKSWNNGSTAGNGVSMVTNVTSKTLGGSPDATTYVETGHFAYSGTDYLYVTNRRTLAGDARFIRTYLNGNKKVINLATNKIWLVASGGSFVDQIGPGDGMLYKVETLNLSPYVHVPSGQTYYIDPGNTFSFSSGGSLYVQGKLTALGSPSEPIVFTSASNWIGVNFDGSGASNSELRYCTINNCSGYGIQVKGNTGITLSHLNINGISSSAAGVFFAQGAGGTLEHSEINGCGNGQGVFITGGSSPTLLYNQIEDNYYDGVLISGNGTATPRLEGNILIDNGVVSGEKTYYGVYVLNSRAEVVQNTVEGSLYGLAGSDYASINPSAYGEDGCNVVSSNTYGLLAYNYSGINLGETNKPNYFNKNSILGNTTYQAVAGNSSSITALADWWGSSSPSASWFYSYGSSTINYQPWLTSFPSCGEEFIPEGPPILSEEALSAESEQLVRVLEGDATIEERQKALVGLYNLFRDTRDMSLITEIGRFAAPESDLSTLATELLMYAHTWTGEYEKAAKAAGTLRESSTCGDVEMRTLAHMAHLVGFSASQRSVSKQAYDELVRSFGDIVNQSLLSALKALNDISTPSSFQATLGSAIAEFQELEVQVREFALGQNYPNPFNPTTTISYVLPERSHVSLIVYNALGQVISMLVDGYQEEGYHEVRFDGRGLSSGIYLYTLQAGEFVQTRTMLLLR